MSKTFENLFLSIGAMKAGTTWLYAALNKHPELHFCAEKELHYFYHRNVDQSVLRSSLRQARARQKYLRNFRGEKGRKELPAARWQSALKRRLGPFFPRRQLDLAGLSEAQSRWITNYLSSPVDDQWYNSLYPLSDEETFACEFSNLSALLPEQVWSDLVARAAKLRVMYTLRDPIKRLWSHTKFELEMTRQLHLLDRWKPEDYQRFARRPEVWRHGEYGQICQTLRRALPQDATYIQFYEDMKSDPLGSLRAIEGFLGITPFNYPKWVLGHSVVASKNLPMPDFYPSLFAQDVARIKGELADLGLDPNDRWL